MKGPTYILKRAYLENIQEKEYLKHIYSLQYINGQKTQLNSQLSHLDHQIQLTKNNKSNSRKFQEDHIAFERQFANHSLVEKIRKLHDLKPIPNIKQSKSLIATSKKLEEERIVLENLRLAKRMVKLPSVVSKAKQDKSYKNTQSHQNITRRFHSPPNKLIKRFLNTAKIRSEAIKSAYNSPTTKKILWSQINIQFKKVNFNKEIPTNTDVLFLVEVKLINQDQFRTKPVTFEELQKECITLQMPQQQMQEILDKQESIQLRIWKLKSNIELYMGKTDIIKEDFFKSQTKYSEHQQEKIDEYNREQAIKQYNMINQQTKEEEQVNKHNKIIQQKEELFYQDKQQDQQQDKQQDQQQDQQQHIQQVQQQDQQQDKQQDQQQDQQQDIQQDIQQDQQLDQIEQITDDNKKGQDVFMDNSISQDNQASQDNQIFQDNQINQDRQEKPETQVNQKSNLNQINQDSQIFQEKEIVLQHNQKYCSSEFDNNLLINFQNQMMFKELNKDQNGRLVFNGNIQFSLSFINQLQNVKNQKIPNYYASKKEEN